MFYYIFLYPVAFSSGKKCFLLSALLSAAAGNIPFRIEAINWHTLNDMKWYNSENYGIWSTKQGEQMSKKIIGLVAHVDAGKTTLAEAILYTAGSIRKLGRVDHGDCFLDGNALERRRGITIFAKPAQLHYGSSDLVLLDTPGHADFVAETERVLRALDAAVLVVSGTDGVQAYTLVLWNLLQRYSIPVAVFITKMDVSFFSHEKLLSDLEQHFGAGFADFSEPDPEQIAMVDETALEEFVTTGSLSVQTISQLLLQRKLYPCFFGSGLHLDGIDTFLQFLDRYIPVPDYGEKFQAYVIKISHDVQGIRETYIKLTGGTLYPRQEVPEPSKDPNGMPETEKINQIRLYSGNRFTPCTELCAGDIAAVTGLAKTSPGMILGRDASFTDPILEPVLRYRIIPDDRTELGKVYDCLSILEDEEPLLHLQWSPDSRNLYVHIMGPVQLEVLQRLAEDRFGLRLSFGQGQILYRETIASPVEGVGHFEPLHHYAEVHVALLPQERNSGISVTNACEDRILPPEWQKTILQRLRTRQHLGVLTGTPLTDVEICLLAGRASLSHSSAADFCQAADRAVRQGLMKADSILLEPYYAFTLAVPSNCLGRTISDLQARGAAISAPETRETSVLLHGRAPAAALQNYKAELLGYTHGRGQLVTRFDGYEECRNAQKVIDAYSYNPEADKENTPDSVFFSHGAGFSVKWNEVESFMHIDTHFSKPGAVAAPEPTQRYKNFHLDDLELEEIMNREFGPIHRPQYSKSDCAPQASPPQDIKSRLLLVDGYNVIFAWEDLRQAAERDIGLARTMLIDRLASFCSCTNCEIVLVFDAYQVKGGTGTRSHVGLLQIVYTSEGQTADAYITSMIKEIGSNYRVQVISSDSLIQLSALGSGVLRTSAREFRFDVDLVLSQMRKELRRMNAKNKNSKLGELVEHGGTQS